MLNESIQTILGISDSHHLGWNEDTAAKLLSLYAQGPAQQGVSLDDYIEAAAQAELDESREMSDELPAFTLKPGGEALPAAVAEAAAGDVVFALPNRQFLIVPSTELSPDGVGHIRILDVDGEELVYWDSAEWGDDPELVMGAIWGSIIGGAGF